MPFPRQQEKLAEWEEYIDTLISMEQLWLAFVMWEIYQKTWIDGKWVKS